MDEREFESFVVKHLKERGYPEKSIVLQWTIKKRYQIDIAIIDPNNNQVIAFIDVKRIKRSQHSPHNTKMQMLGYLEEYGDTSIPTYIFFGNEDSHKPFTVYHLVKSEDKTGYSEVEITDIPGYAELRNSAIQKNRTKSIKERKTTVETFQWMCWTITIIVLVLLVLDILDVIKMTAERISLIGIMIGLVIIPFANKIKFLGMEFERLHKEKE